MTRCTWWTKWHDRVNSFSSFKLRIPRIPTEDVVIDGSTGANVTLQELEQTLPNGFHDAELVRVHIDYESQLAVFELNLDASVSEREEDRYRPGRITFSDVAFVVVDPPAGEIAVGVSTITAGTGQPGLVPRLRSATP